MVWFLGEFTFDSVLGLGAVNTAFLNNLTHEFLCI